MSSSSSHAITSTTSVMCVVSPIVSAIRWLRSPRPVSARRIDDVLQRTEALGHAPPAPAAVPCPMHQNERVTHCCLRVSVSVLIVQSMSRRFRRARRRKRAVERDEVVMRQQQIDRGEVLVDMRRRSGFRNDDHAVLPHQPGERHLRGRRVVLLRRRRATRRGRAAGLARSANRP